LAGHVDNSNVLNFYKENYVNLFINLSESEGLPVSMMEAISYGIPIIACKVCGIPEIVINEKTGLLLDVNEDVGVISKKIEQALFFNFNRKAIVDFFYQHFEANMNYLSFTKSILNENTDK
jgi:glycosyltransferase involved in cell wall biosynthesis